MSTSHLCCEGFQDGTEERQEYLPKFVMRRFSEWGRGEVRICPDISANVRHAMGRIWTGMCYGIPIFVKVIM